MRRMPALIPSLALALSLTAAPAFAAFDGPGATNKAGGVSAQAQAPLNKAAQVATAPHDSPCLLEGNLVERTSGRKNRYVFKDESGTITVKIGEKQLRNRTLGPGNKVRLSGEVEAKRDRPPMVDVDWIEVIK